MTASQDRPAHSQASARGHDRAVALVIDEPERRDEERLLAEVGVDPDDPELSTEVRRLEAGATDDLPFGPPGAPLSDRTPFVSGAGAALGVLLVVALAVAAYLVADILVVILVAAFLAAGLDPAVCWLQRHTAGSRGIAVAIVIAVVGLTLLAFTVLGLPALFSQANELRTDAPRYAEQLRDGNRALENLDRRVGWVSMVKRATSEKALQGASGRRGLLQLATGVAAAAVATLTCVVLTIYFLARLPSLKSNAYRLIPHSRRARVTLLIDEMLQRIGRYVLGNLATSVVAGVAAYVVLKALGVPHALALALFVALMDLVPLVGATIGAAVSVAVALTVSVATGMAMVVFFVVYQQFENFILIPRVMQKTVEVSPVATIVAVLLGAALLGVVGAILAVPTAAALQLVGRHVWLPRQEAR